MIKNHLMTRKIMLQKIWLEINGFYIQIENLDNAGILSELGKLYPW